LGALRTLFMLILLLPVFAGMSGFVPQAEVAQEHLLVQSAAAVDHLACAEHHDGCSGDSCCLVGNYLTCTVLPGETESIFLTETSTAELLSDFGPLWAGRTIRPAQEPPRQI